MPGEIIPHREFYDYTAKYLEEGTRLMIPAKLQARRCENSRSTPCARFAPGMPRDGARGFFPRESAGGKIFLNEVNTIPGFTSISMYPKMWEASGIPFRELIDRLIELALEEHREKERTKYAIELPESAGGALEA